MHLERLPCFREILSGLRNILSRAFTCIVRSTIVLTPCKILGSPVLLMRAAPYGHKAGLIKPVRDVERRCLSLVNSPIHLAWPKPFIGGPWSVFIVATGWRHRSRLRNRWRYPTSMVFHIGSRWDICFKGEWHSNLATRQRDFSKSRKACPLIRRWGPGPVPPWGRGPVELAVLNRLGDVGGGNGFLSGQIRDRAGHL